MHTVAGKSGAAGMGRSPAGTSSPYTATGCMADIVRCWGGGEYSVKDAKGDQRATLIILRIVVEQILM